MVAKDSDISQAILQTSKVFRAVDSDGASNSIANEGSDVMFEKSIGGRSTRNLTFFGGDGVAVVRRIKGQIVQPLVQSLRRGPGDI